MKKLMMIIMISAVVLLTGCKQKEDNVLVVLTSTPYEPFEMIDTNGELTGFDIELMEALAEVAGYTIEWKDVSFEGIIASLQSGQHDIAIAGLNPTSGREEEVDFGNVYYNSEDGLENYFVFESTDSITSLDDLSGLVVGAQLGTVQAEILAELQNDYNFTIEYRSTNTQIIEEIKIGSIDVLLVEQIISESIMDVNSGFSKMMLDYELEQLYGYAIAFSEGSEYKAIFDDALDVLKENGTLDELIEKWFN